MAFSVLRVGEVSHLKMGSSRGVVSLLFLQEARSSGVPRWQCREGGGVREPVARERLRRAHVATRSPIICSFSDALEEIAFDVLDCCENRATDPAGGQGVVVPGVQLPLDFDRYAEPVGIRRYLRGVGSEGITGHLEPVADIDLRGNRPGRLSIRLPVLLGPSLDPLLVGAFQMV